MEVLLMMNLEELFGKHFNGVYCEDITKEDIMKYARIKVEEERHFFKTG